MKTNRLILSLFGIAFSCVLLGRCNARADVFYVSNYGDSTIVRFDSAGNPTLFSNTGLNGPNGLALDASGNLFVVNTPAGSIAKYDPMGNLSLFANSGLMTPTGAVFDSAGNLYVANYDGQTITRFNPAGAPSVFAASGLNYPAGLAFDSSGNLYVANHNGNTIRKFSPTGGDLGVFASAGLNGPEGLAFDSAGNLYAANYGLYNTDFSVVKFSPTGDPLGVFATSGLNYPVGLAFDSAGNLYVVNHGNSTIRKFSPSGTDLGTFASAGLNGPVFIVVQASAPPFDFAGFLPPIGGADDSGGSFLNPLRRFKVGSVIPVKFVISSSEGLVLDGEHTLQVIKYSSATTFGPPLAAIPQDVASPGNQFRLSDGQWQFNLDTKATGMSAGIWQFVATLSDASQHSVWIQLK
jgi:sugar lactone lactonase YvrE